MRGIVSDSRELTALTSTPVVVFDGDCAFCTTCMLWLQRQFPAAFDSKPYQRADLASWGLTTDECHAKLQWLGRPDAVDGDRGRLQGSLAVGAILRTGGRAVGGLRGLGWRSMGELTRVPPTSWIAMGIYAWVAANRQRLPGGTPACQM